MLLRWVIMTSVYARPGHDISRRARYALFRSAAPPAYATSGRRAGVPCLEPSAGNGDGFRRRARGDGRLSLPLSLLRSRAEEEKAVCASRVRHVRTPSPAEGSLSRSRGAHAPPAHQLPMQSGQRRAPRVRTARPQTAQRFSGERAPRLRLPLQGGKRVSIITFAMSRNRLSRHERADT